MKKIYAAVLVLLLVSCAPKEEAAVVKPLSIEDVPKSEETRKLDRKEIYTLKRQLEQIPVASSEEFFTGEVTEFLKGYENTELESLEVVQDTLSLIPGKNKKSLYNLSFRVRLVTDRIRDEEGMKQADRLAEEITDFLKQYSYVGLKSKDVWVKVYNQNGEVLSDMQSSVSISNETMFVEIPEDEYEIQTRAFKYSGNGRKFQLKKFGPLSGTGELYVEYAVDDGYFDFDDLDGSIAGLEAIGEEIREYLLLSEKTEKYMESYHLNVLTISFYSGNFDDDYVTFNFDI